MRRTRDFGRLRSLTRPNGLLLALAVIIFAVLGVQALAGAWSVGVTIDEPAHVERLRGWIETGYYMPPFTLIDGQPDPTNELALPYLYGAAFSSSAHLVNVALGHEGLSEVVGSGSAYATRRVVVALLGIAAALGVAVAVRAITKDRVAAVFSAAAVLAIPVWTGRAMWNIKDVPAGAGYTLVTAGFVVALAGAKNQPSRWRVLAGGGLVGVGVFYAAGTRPALWVPLTLSLAAFIVASSLLLARSGRLGLPPAAPIIGFVIGFLAVSALQARVTLNPTTWMIGSVTDSSGHPQSIPQLVGGISIDSVDAPIWYLPAVLAAGMPLLLLGLGVLGFLVYGRRALSLRKPLGAHGPADCRDAAAVFLAMQVALLPAAASLAANSGTQQHHLYVFPAAAGLAGLGAHWLLEHARRERASTIWRWGVAGGLAVALLVPAIEQSRLYPYNYVYVNPLAGVRGLEGYWETEGAWASSREAFRRVPGSILPACSLSLVWAGGDDDDFTANDCGPHLPPYADEVGEDSTAERASGELWIVGRRRAENRPPSFCEDASSITRPLRGEKIVMGYVLRCTPSDSVLSTQVSPEALEQAGFTPP